MSAKQTPQHLAALAKANETRMANADLRRRIEALPEADARNDVATILEQPNDTVGALPIGRLLGMIHRFGDCRSAKVLQRAGVLSGDRRVRDLTVRQRKAVATALREPVSTHPQRVESVGLPLMRGAA